MQCAPAMRVQKLNVGSSVNQSINQSINQSLLCFCDAAVFSVNTDLYNHVFLE